MPCKQKKILAKRIIFRVNRSHKKYLTSIPKIDVTQFLLKTIIGWTAITGFFTGAGTCFAASLLDTSNTLLPGETMYPGDKILSNDRKHWLRFQTDGNLVLYSQNDNTPTWASNTAYNDTSIRLVAMQGDGNLVMYDYNLHPVWSSGTAGNNGAYLKVQNDGNLVIYPHSLDPTTADSQNWRYAKWSSNTYQK